MKQKNTERRILDESLEWIRHHLAATNHDVPESLREEWILDTSDENTTSVVSITAFVFGYCQTQFASRTPGAVELSTAEIAEKFQCWQMKLGLAELHDRTDLQSEPMPLFTFTPGESVRFWTDLSKLRHAPSRDERAQ